MSDKPQRFIRNIMGDIYDRETDKWFEEDWKGKPLDYDDDLVVFLNEQQARIEMLEKGILDCLFNNKSIGMLAEEMGLVE